MADPRDALIAELQKVNEQLGALVAQQQSVMAAQRQLIADLERRLSEQDAAYAARATFETSTVYEYVPGPLRASHPSSREGRLCVWGNTS